MVKEMIKGVLFLLYKRLFSVIGKLLPKDNQLIVFESFLGKQFSDSPRAIYEYMQYHYPEYEMYWSIEGKSINSFKDESIIPLKRFSLKWLWVMNRSKYWISNSRLPLWIPKPAKTIYVQTWHGTPLKRLALDMEEVHMPGTNTKQYKENFITESAKWDYLVSPNVYSTEIFKRAFKFNKPIIESGYPRNDYLINSNTEKEVRKIKSTLKLPEGKKVILYAPTWRDNEYHAIGKYKFNLELDLDKMRNQLGEDYVIILRMHYLVADNVDLSEYQGFVYDLSTHADIRELYLISDMLITDYSSVFFDYANLKRPILFFVYDIDDYRDNLRGFYFDFEKLAPGPLVKTTDELLKQINTLNIEEFKPSAEISAFYETYCSLEDGNSTKRVVKAVFN